MTSSCDISLHDYFTKVISALFPPFPHIVLFRTSPYLSALLRVSLSFPFLAFPCFTMIILLSVPSLASVSFSLVSPFLSAPYIGYYVTHFVTHTSGIPYIPVISIYTRTLLAYFSSL